MKPGVLLDLGNTLAAYYRPDEFLPILEVAIGDVVDALRSMGVEPVPLDAALASAALENRESKDFRFTPMVERFERIFRVPLVDDPQLSTRLCEVFLRPIFSVGRVYDDTLPVLHCLGGSGHPLAIVSNAPWGSPPDMWRAEIGRLGLSSLVDAVVLCGDVGWRKPAREIFEYSAAALDRAPEQCIFVGDDLRWDIAGGEAVGMRSILIDRDRRNRHYAGERVEDLEQLLAMIGPGG